MEYVVAYLLQFGSSDAIVLQLHVREWKEGTKRNCEETGTELSESHEVLLLETVHASFTPAIHLNNPAQIEMQSGVKVRASMSTSTCHHFFYSYEFLSVRR
jgi:hypothetical protein